DQASVGAEARFGVLHAIERRDGIVAVLEATQDAIEGVALGRHATGVANPAVQLGGPDELAVLGAGRRGDRFVDERAAEVVGPGVEQRLGELWSFLHPRGLDVAE